MVRNCSQNSSNSIVKMIDSGRKQIEISRDAQYVESGDFLHNHEDVLILQ